MRLGADPEIFLQDGNGKPVSVIGLINADKWHPLQIPGMQTGFTLQEDNVALEYGIPPAATCEEFVNNIQAVMEKSKEWLNGLQFSKLSCIVFPKEQLAHPAAHQFGCEPDYDAWTKKVNMPPRPPNENMRSAGGHIHVETKKDPYSVVKYMDLFLHVPSVLMDEGAERKKLYGKAGACRIKSYGPEYRSLSNFWILDKKYIEWVWRNTERALACEMNIDVLEPYIRQACDRNDKDMAEFLCETYDLEVV